MSKKRNLPNESYLDIELKEFIIKYGKQLFGFEVRLNYEEPYGADLVAVHDPSIKIELERSGAVYDFWNDVPQDDNEKGYQYKMDYDFKHVNMEIDRKGHFFQKRHLKYPEKPECSWNPMIDNPSYDKTIFVRTDFFFHQIIIVPNEVIRDPEKTLLCWKSVRNNKNKKPEHWASWRYEDTFTFNRFGDNIIRETEDPSTHLPPISDEERKFLIKRMIKEKREAKEKERQDNLKRAAEVYRQSKNKK